MKLNPGISVLTKTRYILSCISQLIVQCIHHPPWDGCVLWVLSFLLSLCSCLFSLSLPLTNSSRNPDLNASCCGFLQRLSVCLLSQSGPASDGTHTLVHNTLSCFICSHSKNLVMMSCLYEIIFIYSLFKRNKNTHLTCHRILVVP